MVGPDHPPYYLGKITMMNLRQKSFDMAPGGATRRPLTVQTATAEERGVTPSRVVKLPVVDQSLPQEVYNLREPDTKGVAFRCVRLQQGNGMSRE